MEPMFGNLFEAWDRGAAVSAGNNGFRTSSVYLFEKHAIPGL
jgi:hypothetical protein